MPLTKKQKVELIDQFSKKLKESGSAVFAEFKGVTTEEFKRLRRELKKASADLKVTKKRLLNLAFENVGVPFDLSLIKEQLATIFAKGDLNSVAATVFKFVKDIVRGKKGNFSVLSAYDFNEKRLIDSNEFKIIATLPSREVLLAQIVMMLMMPLKQMMSILNERAKSAGSGSPDSA